MVCALCDRDDHTCMEDHHLIPKMFDGIETVPMHRVCHRMIHCIFSEKELRDTYNTIESLKEKFEDFIRFVSKKHPEWDGNVFDTYQRKRQRRRK